MAVTISFWNTANEQQIPNSSGIGFYGAAFGSSVPVGSYANRAFVSNSGGTTQGAELNSLSYVSSTGVSINGSGAIPVLNVPNYQSSFYVKVASDSGTINVENMTIKVGSRSDINSPVSGVQVYGLYINHTDTSQAVAGSGSPTWINLSTSGAKLSPFNNPGISGGYAVSGSVRADTEHWFYTALSTSPNSIGSKYFSLQASCEYL
jgi:hypothetical protein